MKTFVALSCITLVASAFATLTGAADVPEKRVLVVNRQGVAQIPYSDALTASKAIIATGGYSDFSRTSIFLVRSAQAARIDMDAVIRGREKDVRLRPWDIIIVGNRKLRR